MLFRTTVILILISVVSIRIQVSCQRHPEFRNPPFGPGPQHPPGPWGPPPPQGQQGPPPPQGQHNPPPHGQQNHPPQQNHPMFPPPQGNRPQPQGHAPFQPPGQQSHQPQPQQGPPNWGDARKGAFDKSNDFQSAPLDQDDQRSIDENEINEIRSHPELPPAPEIDILDGIDRLSEEIVEAVVERLEEDEAMAIELERRGFDPDDYSSADSVIRKAKCTNIVMIFAITVIIIIALSNGTEGL